MKTMIIDDIDLHIDAAGSIDRAALVPGMYFAWCVNLQLVAATRRERRSDATPAASLSGTDASGVLPESRARAG